MATVKLTLQTHLLPDGAQSASLKATVERFNQAANWLAGEAFERQTANKLLLQKLYYPTLRAQFGLSAQMAVRCIAQVCEAYKRDRSKRPVFRKHAAIPYDQRLMSFKGVDRIYLLTLGGRVIVPVVMGRYQAERYTLAKGQSDLVLRKDGKWFLLVTVDLPEGTPTPSSDFIGVDFGVENLATSSDGEQASGAGVEKTRERYHEQRRELQRAGERRKARGRRPKQIRRKLKDISARESRFRRHTNHSISKELVAKAKDTRRGIALEDLSGIRQRTRFRKPQRARMSGWSFFQLRVFIEYKARLAGVPVVLVDPRHTSRVCSRCGPCEKANRRSQAEFECRRCGYCAHADYNAAQNIRARAAVSAPKVSEPRLVA